MGIVDQIRSKRAKGIVGEPINTAKPSESSINWWNGGTTNDAGFVATPGEARQVDTFYRSVTIISTSLAHLPLPFPSEDKRGRDPQGRKLRAWYLMNVMFNPETTAMEGRMIMWQHWCCHGNAYAQKIRNAFGETIELWNLDPARMRVWRNPEGRVIYSYTTPDGKTHHLEREDVFHVRGPIIDGLLGVSPIQVMANSLGLSRNMQRFSNKLFANGAAPGGVLETPEKFKDHEAIERLRKQWEVHNHGLENVGRPIILEAGLKWSTTAVTPQDGQMLQSREFEQLTPGRILGVPPVKLGITTGATFASVEMQNLSFVVDSLVPYAVIFQQAVVRDLMSDAERIKYSPRHNFKALLRGDTATRNASYIAGRQWGWYSVNDIRDLEDLPLVEDGDTYLCPTNMMDAAILKDFWFARLESTKLNNEASKKKMEQPPVSMTPQAQDVVDAQVVPAKTIEPSKKSRDIPALEDLRQKALMQPEIRLAYLQMLIQSTDRCARKELKAVESILKKASRDGNIDTFTRNIDEFYSDHSAYLAEEMTPVARSLAIQYGDLGAEIAPNLAEKVRESSEKIAKEARNRLNLQNFSNEKEVFVKLGGILDEWRDQRSKQMADEVMAALAGAIEDRLKCDS